MNFLVKVIQVVIYPHCGFRLKTIISIVVSFEINVMKMWMPSGELTKSLISSIDSMRK